MANNEGLRRRVIIETVNPSINNGAFPVRRVPGESIDLEVHAYADGHDVLTVIVRYKHEKAKRWELVELTQKWNDEWLGSFKVEKEGYYSYKIMAWVDHYKSWKKGLIKKAEAKQDLSVEYKIGEKLLRDAASRAKGEEAKYLNSHADILARRGDDALAAAVDEKLEFVASLYPDPALVTEFGKELKVRVDRKLAGFSSWYEIFPRSCSDDVSRHGTFADTEKKLDMIKDLGFNIVYFPPIHPVGVKGRKGKNNTLKPAPDDPGSPWAVRNHKEVNPELGTMADFEKLVKAAEKKGLETALDIAFQCAPDHPYLKEHPEWFLWRPDGSIQYAENPPKRYEDIVPFNFETENPMPLWEELTSVFLFWAEKGVKIFRVDNPHTKAFAFWEYSIAKVKEKYPEVIFLAEAFTRPKITHMLAKLGYTQSYTYFTWRNTKKEIEEYVNELTASPSKEYFSPNFWPNTPDILHEYLQKGGRAAHIARLVLAATLSSNYGIYGGAYITCDNEPFPGKEENNNNEKYELKAWDLHKPGSIYEEVKRVNSIRNSNSALQTTWNTKFLATTSDDVTAYIKVSPDGENALITVVNLNCDSSRTAIVYLNSEEHGLPYEFYVDDLLWGGEYKWRNGGNYVELKPWEKPAHIFRVRLK